MKFNNKQEKFGIRKYKSIGATSAMIGAVFFLVAGGREVALANETQPTVKTETRTLENEPKVEAESKSVNESESKPANESKVEAESKPANESKVETESKPENEPKVETESKPANEPKVRGKRSLNDASSIDHGKLIETDDHSGYGYIGELYEDGTYVVKSSGNEDSIRMYNGDYALSSMLSWDPDKLVKVKKIKVVGNSVFNQFDVIMGGGLNPTVLDMNGVTLSDTAPVPFLTYLDDTLEEIRFDPNFGLSNIVKMNRMFDRASKLKLTNDQVTQLLKNVAFDSKKGYDGPLWRKVGVERLDLSSFDNSKWDAEAYESSRIYETDRSITTKAMFKDLIGLKEVVFGDKFDFGKYARKNTVDAFMDTDLSGVERVNMLASKEHNDKFIKDWAAEVKTMKNRTDMGTLSLLKDGVAIKSIDDVLSATDSTYEVGMYTIDYVVKKHIYQADESKEYGYMSFYKPEGGPEVVILGTKPTTEVTYQDFNTRYVADPDRAEGEKFTETEGVRGTTTTITTYSVNTDTGVVTPIKGQPVVVAPKDEVVKVGTKSISIETHTPIEVVYKADRTIEKGQEVIESQGKLGVKVVKTPKILNINDGTVSDGTPVIEETVMEPKVIKVGTKSKVVTVVIEPTVTYTGDKTKVVGSENVTELGAKGSKVTTTTYTVNEKTGEVIPHVGEPVITKAGTTVVKVGAQDKVTYKKQGNDVVKVITSYEVDSKTGKLTEKTTESVYAKDGARDKVVTEVIEPVVTYTGDKTKVVGSENVTEAGTKGSKVTTTTYTVNEKTGEVIPHVGEPVITKAGITVVKVGAQDKVTYKKQGNDVVKVTTSYEVDSKTGKLTEKTTESVHAKDGAKDKVVTEVIESVVEYVSDDYREKGTDNEVIKGNKGSKVRRITYSVNPNTGEVSEISGKVEIIPAGKTIVKVGTKSKYVTKELEPTVEYVNDDSREKGTPNEEIKGNKGVVVVISTYKVNSKTGEVTETVGELVVSAPGKTIIKVGSKEPVVKFVPNEAPKVDIPEFKGGVTPNEAPKVEVPEFKGGVIPNKAQVIESKVNAKLPETGGINTGVHGLLALAAGSLLYAKNRKKEM